MASEHTTPEHAIADWLADRSHLDSRDASDLIVHLYDAGWTFRRTDEIAIDRVDAERVAEGSESTSQLRVKAALEQQVAEPAPLSADETIQTATAHWLSPHIHRGVPARLSTAAGERDVIVRLAEDNRAEWTPATADSDEQALEFYLFRFPVNVNTDSDTLGAIQILGSKLTEVGHRYELVNEPPSGTASVSSGQGENHLDRAEDSPGGR